MALAIAAVFGACRSDRDASGDTSARAVRAEVERARRDDMRGSTREASAPLPAPKAELADAACARRADEPGRQAGVDVAVRDDRGATHEFLGMTAALEPAREAQAFACERLRRSWRR